MLRATVVLLGLLGAPAAAQTRAVTLILGAKDNTPSSWNGAATISAGEIVRIKGYHFTAKDRIDGAAWRCATHPWPTNQGGMHPNEQPQPHQTMVAPIGVTIEYRAPSDASIRVALEGREAFSFRPSDIPENGALFPLRGMIEVWRTPVVERLSGAEAHDDYPAIAVEGDTVWISWMAYRDSTDQVMLRARRAGQWQAPASVSEKAGDYFGTAVAASGGKAMVVWSAHEGETWQLRYRIHDGSRLGPVGSITSGQGKNLFHRIAAGAGGAFHVVYQSWRGGRSDIYLRSYANGAWGPELNLSDPARPARANDWSPAVAVDSSGAVWVAWDGYARGSYNVYLRPVRRGAAGELIPVTDSERFHAHPSLAVDSQDRIWVAWDEAPENWGKDLGFLLTGGSGLYHARDIRVAVYSAGQWMEPVRQPGSVVPWGYKRYFHTPRLAADTQGRIWLFARPRTEATIPHSVWAAGGKWEVTASHYSGEAWSDLLVIPDSVAGNEGELQVAPDGDGGVLLAALTDSRLWGGPNFGEKPADHDIVFARVTASGAGRPMLASRRPEAPTVRRAEVNEAEQIARLRSYELSHRGQSLRIFRGDLHRHTDISMDGAGDGSVWDAYRYMMDGAGMDFFLLTDHHSGGYEYGWWKIDKSADMFHVPGFFTAFYGYERSVGYPNGHRNVLFTQRGVPYLDNDPSERGDAGSSGKILYPYLRRYNGIAFSHTSHTTMGTDWRDNDPDLEPIVEIFQGARTSAEHEGAPLAPTEQRTELHAGGYRPLGFVWNAWKKGYKLGVQASSDHVSTHTSYACVIAENGSREALVDAMRKRHTYAATSNIILDYRVETGGETYLQGDILKTDAPPRISARIVGTAPLKEVVVVRDNEYVYSARPGEETYLLSFRETTLAPGEHYYYIRAEQTDGNVAWSSPVWVTR